MWYFEVSILHGLALFQIKACVVSLAKLLFKFIFEKKCVWIEMLVAQIPFLYHLQVQTSDLQLSK